jgi:hypothetical protein
VVNHRRACSCAMAGSQSRNTHRVHQADRDFIAAFPSVNLDNRLFRAPGARNLSPTIETAPSHFVKRRCGNCLATNSPLKGTAEAVAIEYKAFFHRLFSRWGTF